MICKYLLPSVNCPCTMIVFLDVLSFFTVLLHVFTLIFLVEIIRTVSRRSEKVQDILGEKL